MEYGICNIGIVPIREKADDRSEMVSQILYGEPFKVLVNKSKWCFVRLKIDKYEGWVSENQIHFISKITYQEIDDKNAQYCQNIVDYVSSEPHELIPITLGANLSVLKLLNHCYSSSDNEINNESIIDTAYKYLNAPYLWGGKTPLGIDCSGLSQMVYKFHKISLPRDACQQVLLGNTLSFVQEAKAGDLAFFDNTEGEIVHVGILLDNHKIIHAHGKVRIDFIDQTGIYNADSQTYTHRLRVIKQLQ